MIEPITLEANANITFRMWENSTAYFMYEDPVSSDADCLMMMDDNLG
jgi:hypothetical protein